MKNGNMRVFRILLPAREKSIATSVGIHNYWLSILEDCCVKWKVLGLFSIENWETRDNEWDKKAITKLVILKLLLGNPVSSPSPSSKIPF